MIFLFVGRIKCLKLCIGFPKQNHSLQAITSHAAIAQSESKTAQKTYLLNLLTNSPLHSKPGIVTLLFFLPACQCESQGKTKPLWVLYPSTKLQTIINSPAEFVAKLTITQRFCHVYIPFVKTALTPAYGKRKVCTFVSLTQTFYFSIRSIFPPIKERDIKLNSNS